MGSQKPSSHFPAQLDESINLLLTFCEGELPIDSKDRTLITGHINTLREFIEDDRNRSEYEAKKRVESIPEKRSDISWTCNREYDVRTALLSQRNLLSIRGVVFMTEVLCCPGKNDHDSLQNWDTITQTSSDFVDLIAKEIRPALVPPLVQSLLKKDWDYKSRPLAALDFIILSDCEALVIIYDIFSPTELMLLFAICNFLRIHCVCARELSGKLTILPEETNEMNRKFQRGDPLKKLDVTLLSVLNHAAERKRSSAEMYLIPLRLIVPRKKHVLNQFDLVKTLMKAEFDEKLSKDAPRITESLALDNLQSELNRSLLEIKRLDTNEILRRIESWQNKRAAEQDIAQGSSMNPGDAVYSEKDGSADVDDPAKEPPRKRGRPAKASQNGKAEKDQPVIASIEDEEEVQEPVQLRRGRSNATLPNGNSTASSLPAKKSVTRKSKKQESDDDDGKLDANSGGDTISAAHAMDGKTAALVAVTDEDKPKAQNRGRKAKTIPAAAVSNTVPVAAAATGSSVNGSDAVEDEEDKEVTQKKRSRRAPKAAANAVNMPSTSAPDQSDDVPTNSNGSKKSGAKKATGSLLPESESDPEPEEPAVTKKVIIKGRAPVDEIVADAHSRHVYEEGDNVYDAALNQTNVGNSNSKFYFIQLLEHVNRKEFHVMTRWGRVGATGQHSMDAFGTDLEAAKKLFCKKFSDKTKNKWEDRADFQKTPGKYDLIYRDYTAKDDQPEDVPDSKAVVKSKPAEKPQNIPSSLHPDVQELIKLIFDIQMMEQQAVEMEYDTKKAPLCRLTNGQILQGYNLLKKIETLLNNPLHRRGDLLEACNEYYTRIPHAFGFRTPPAINTTSLIKREMELLELLGDIQIAMRQINSGDALNKSGGDVPAMNPIDHRYLGLKIELNPVDRAGPTFELIKNYLEWTHGPTHCDYSLELLSAFEAKKSDMEPKFKKDLDNRMLLWHGSRLSNYVGILSQGLRIAPPEAPVTGYMFGKGVYFSDVSSKSANQCYHHSSNGVGLMLLCEVALGKLAELYEPKYDADKLPLGTYATKGVGRHAPDEKTYKILEDGVKVPVGKCVNHATSRQNNYTLDYNEYIVYNTEQVRMRFLCQVKFNDKRRRF